MTGYKKVLEIQDTAGRWESIPCRGQEAPFRALTKVLGRVGIGAKDLGEIDGFRGLA